MPFPEQQWSPEMAAILTKMVGATGIGPVTPADVYFGRGQTILEQRERIKRKTIQTRRLHHRQVAA